MIQKGMSTGRQGRTDEAMS